MLVASLSILYCLSVQRLGNPKMRIVYCSAPSYMQHFAPTQLQNLFTHPALPYITWGLIWYLKIMTKREIPAEKFYWTASKP